MESGPHHVLLCRFRDILTTSRVVRRCELVEEDFNFGFEPPFDGECPSHDGRGRPPVPSSGNPASSVLEPGGPGPLRSPGWDVEKTWGSDFRGGRDPRGLRSHAQTSPHRCPPGGLVGHPGPPMYPSLTGRLIFVLEMLWDRKLSFAERWCPACSVCCSPTSPGTRPLRHEMKVLISPRVFSASDCGD